MCATRNLSVQLNDDYEKLRKAGYEYVEGTIVPQPISRPQFTLNELRNAIPAHCFKRSMLKSFGYLGLDLVYISTMLYCAYILLEQQDLPYSFQIVGYLIYWCLQGSVLLGIWSLAHECGHGAFSESDTVNDVVGLIIHSALLTPYHSWKISHRKHHGNTGSCENDEAFVPFTQDELEPTWSETLDDSPLYHLFKIIEILTIGWPTYLTLNAWGPKKYRNKPKSHFNPNSVFILPKQKPSIVLSDISLALALVTICYITSIFGFPTVLRLYIVPYLIMNAFIITVTYLHHTDTYVPHFREGEWSWLRGSLCTVDRSYGKFLDVILHHITDAHVCHHIFSKIPFYHSVEATEAIKPILGKYYLRDTTPFYLALWREDQKIVEDIISSKWHILLALFIAMICSLILIAMMRWLAAPLLWLSIIGVIVMLGFGTYYSVTQFIQLRDNPIDVPSGYNLSNLVNQYLAKKETWLVLSIISAVVLLIILLVVIFLRKRIVIAIALVKEGSKAVSSTLTTIFFPIFPWLFQILIIIFAIIVGLYLASVGTHVHTVVGLAEDQHCLCTGPAAAYKNNEVCDPITFSENCHGTSSVLTRFLKQGNLNPCPKAACHFKRIDSPYFIGYFHAWNFVGFFWAVFFISAFGEMVLAATFATWYWTFHKSDVPFFTLTVGFTRTIRYHLGTLAFGSLIIAICRMIRVGLEYLDQKLKKYDNAFVRAILCCMKCFFWCLEKFLKFINKNAYIMCAIHGKNFCGSAKDAFNLLMRNLLRVFALDKVTDFLFFLSKLLITLGMGAATHFYLESEYNTHRLHYNFVPVVIVMIGTYLIATVFFGVYSMAVDTLFLCFLEDCERNDGSAAKPYFMSSGLMKILGKENQISRARYQ